jgi:hypothetical protein
MGQVACMRYRELFTSQHSSSATGEAAYLLTTFDAAVHWLARGAPGCD